MQGRSGINSKELADCRFTSDCDLSIPLRSYEQTDPRTISKLTKGQIERKLGTGCIQQPTTEISEMEAHNRGPRKKEEPVKTSYSIHKWSLAVIRVTYHDKVKNVVCLTQV